MIVFSLQLSWFTYIYTSVQELSYIQQWAPSSLPSPSFTELSLSLFLSSHSCSSSSSHLSKQTTMFSGGCGYSRRSIRSQCGRGTLTALGRSLSKSVQNQPGQTNFKQPENKLLHQKTVHVLCVRVRACVVRVRVCACVVRGCWWDSRSAIMLAYTYTYYISTHT